MLKSLIMNIHQMIKQNMNKVHYNMYYSLTEHVSHRAQGVGSVVVVDREATVIGHRD